MPRFFDDYSNTYLTHDSAAGRKQQRRGWKFRENFKLHYQKHLDEWRAGPMGLAAAQQGFLRSRPPNDPTIPPLPDGWVEEPDEATHISFYIHEESGRRTWVRPGFRPPPAGGGGPPPNFQQRGPPPMGGGGPGFNRPPPPFNSGPPPQQMRGPPPPFHQPPPPLPGGGQFSQPPPPPPGQFSQPPPTGGPPPPFPGQMPPPPR